MVAREVPHAIVIPAQALLISPEGAASVIVLDSNNVPHKQKIEAGIRNGNDVQVTQGLKAGERVITVGAFELGKEYPDVLQKTKIQVQAPEAPAGSETGGQ